MAWCTSRPVLLLAAIVAVAAWNPAAARGLMCLTIAATGGGVPDPCWSLP